MFKIIKKIHSENLQNFHFQEILSDKSKMFICAGVERMEEVINAYKLQS